MLLPQSLPWPRPLHSPLTPEHAPSLPHRHSTRSPNRGRVSPSASMNHTSSSMQPAITSQDYADYGAQEDPHREARMDKTTRTIDGRVAINLPAGGLKAPAGPKAPIFIA